MTLIGQLVPQAAHLFGPTRPPSADPAERRRLLGATQAAERLTEIHFFNQEWARGLGAALETVNLAARLGTSFELVRGYVVLGFGLTAAPLPRLRAVYEARARAAAEELGDPLGIAMVSGLSGISALLLGRFDEARAALDFALATAEEAQDQRNVALASVLLAHLEGLSGRPADTLVRYQRLAELAKKSGSAQNLMWALGGQAECALALGRPEEAIALFTQRRTLTDDYRTDATEWITHGSEAEAHLLVGDVARASHDAERALRQIEQLRVVGFQFYRGYIATGDALFALWDRATAPEERARLARRARTFCDKMRGFAALYPITRPAALRLQGLLDARTGHLARARRAFARSLAEAERLAMPLEQGLAHDEIARHAPIGSAVRAAHAADARAILARSGHHRWLDRIGR